MFCQDNLDIGVRVYERKITKTNVKKKGERYFFFSKIMGWSLILPGLFLRINEVMFFLIDGRHKSTAIISVVHVWDKCFLIMIFKMLRLRSLLSVFQRKSVQYSHFHGRIVILFKLYIKKKFIFFCRKVN